MDQGADRSWIADPPIRRALLSVFDKSGLVELARALCAMRVSLLSTGGSAAVIREAGLDVVEIASVTGFPALLDGRVKSLHPHIHAALLARREVPAHLHTLADHGIATIDLLIVNFYPFASVSAQPGCSLEAALEQIDIGGPAMLRSAAKNWRGVAVLSSPAQYEEALQGMQQRWQQDGEPALGARARFRLAVAAFEGIAAYDAAISNYLGSIAFPAGEGEDGLATSFCAQAPQRNPFPSQFSMCFQKVQDLRYGENPHQRAALYRDMVPQPGALVTAQQLQGKELSFNNLADADAAWTCVRGFARATCVIVKHANPCGVASAGDVVQAYRKALACDPSSAFGGVMAFNREVDAATAQALGGHFVEVLVAPGFSGEALELLRTRSAMRILRVASGAEGLAAEDTQVQGTAHRDAPESAHDAAHDAAHAAAQVGACALRPQDLRRIASGLLVQDADTHDDGQDEALRCVTRAQPSDAQRLDLLFAWRVATYLKSNAIVFARDEQTLGLGAGQMSRLDAARIATFKAQAAGLDLQGSVAASDAFFPFADGLEVLADAGACAVIQPGGSIRDAEVITAADARGLAMLFTGVRHFRH